MLQVDGGLGAADTLKLFADQDMWMDDVVSWCKGSSCHVNQLVRNSGRRTFFKYQSGLPVTSLMDFIIRQRVVLHKHIACLSVSLGEDAK